MKQQGTAGTFLIHIRQSHSQRQCLLPDAIEGVCHAWRYTLLPLNMGSMPSFVASVNTQWPGCMARNLINDYNSVFV